MKKFCFLAFVLCFAAKNAAAWSISYPPETKDLANHLTDCEPFEYTRQNIFDLKLTIKERKDEKCVLSLDLADLVDGVKKNKRKYNCELSDFNLEEVKLAFEQATIQVVDLKKSRDDRVILELFEGFKNNKICR